MPILKAVADEDYMRSPAMAAVRLVGVPSSIGPHFWPPLT
jgi:hypothetical protein